MARKLRILPLPLLPPRLSPHQMDNTNHDPKTASTPNGDVAFVKEASEPTTISKNGDIVIVQEAAELIYCKSSKKISGTNFAAFFLCLLGILAILFMLIYVLVRLDSMNNVS